MSVMPHAPQKEPAPLPTGFSFKPLGKEGMGFRLGPLKLEGRVLLAPMAGYTDRVFRALARRSGAAMVTTEMVSAQALVKDSRKTMKMMEFGEEERPVSVQLFGGDPELMGEAAAITARSVKPDALDVNFGCPVGKILKSDSGAALLKNPKKAGEIVRAMIQATEGKVPITVKTRAGYDSLDGAGLEVLRASEEAGAAAFVLHARTRRQMYSGPADWESIACAKKTARIPVIGNGDVRTPEDAGRMLQETGCDAVMVGRAALGAPWIFRQMNEYLGTGKVPDPVPLRSKLTAALHHFEQAMDGSDPKRALFEMRKHLVHYLKGFDGARDLRQHLLIKADPAQVRRILVEFITRLPEA